MSQLQAEVRQAAESAYRAGLNVCGVKPDGSKNPALSTWKPWQTERMPEDVFRAALARDVDGFGVFGGFNDVELFDVDLHEIWEPFVTRCNEHGLGELLAGVVAGYSESTPNGKHLVYRCAETACGKLARRPDPAKKTGRKTLIELKGATGFMVLAPSGGRTHPSGKPYVLNAGGFDSIVRITKEERAALHDVARSFDEMPQPEAEPSSERANGKANGRADDDDSIIAWFNATQTWESILEPHGWTRGSDSPCGDFEQWYRPGRNWKVGSPEFGSKSASVNEVGRLIVHSTSTRFLTWEEHKHGYDRFAAFALLNHGEDFSAAAVAACKMRDERAKTEEPQGEEEPRFELEDGDFLMDTNPPEIVSELLYEGAVSNVVAGPKVGKSTCMTQLALDLGSGTPFLGLDTRQATVLYVSQELGAAEMRRRGDDIARSLGLSQTLEDLHRLKRFRYLGVTGQRGPVSVDMATPDGRQDMARAVAAARRDSPGLPVVVILDTLEKCVDLEGKDDAGWKMLYQQLPAFAAKHRVALVLVDHTHRARQDADASTAAHGNQHKGRGAAVNVKLDAVRAKKSHRVLYWKLDAASWFGEGVHTPLASPERGDGSRGLGFVPISWEDAELLESQLGAAPTVAEQAKARLQEILLQPVSLNAKELRRMLMRAGFTDVVARQTVKNWTRKDPGGLDRQVWDGE